MSFDGYGLQQQLHDLWQDRKTGTLSTTVKGYEKKLFLKDGIVCFATSNDPDDKLPSVLVRQGRFTEAQFLAVEPKFNDKISIGRNLIEMGLITQAELVEGAKEQIYTVYAGCMLAETGTAQFEEGPLPNGIVSLPLRYPRDLFRAILTMQDKNWISRQFGTALSFVPTPAPGRPALDFSKLELGEFAQPTYKLIDGQLNFNHLTFEAEVDEFTLLKFLYALRLLGQITIEADENEPEPEVESVLEDLGRAMEQSEEVAKLRGKSAYEGLSMDETIAMPTLKGKGVAAPGSLDVTTEISRDVLGQKPLDDLFDDEEEAPHKPAAAFDAFSHEEEEQGLDDLGALGPDFLEREIQRNEQDYMTDGVILPDRDEDEEEDPEEALPEEGDSRRERRNRLMLLAAIGVLATGALLTLRPWLERRFNPFGPSLATSVPDVTQQAKQAATPPVKTETPPIEPEKPAETAVVEAPVETPPQQSASAPTPPVATAEQVATTETSKPQPEPTKAPAQAKPAPQQAKPIQPERQAASNAGFRSPIVEGWDPKTGRPRGQAQAPIDQIAEPDQPSPELLQLSAANAANASKPAPTAEPAARKPATKEQPAQRQPAVKQPAVNAVAQPPSQKPVDPPARLTQASPTKDRAAVKTPERIPQPSPTKPATNRAAAQQQPQSEPQKPAPPAAEPDSEAEAQRLLAEGRYADAAALWRRRAAAGKYTFALSLVCEPANIEKARQAAKGDARLFIIAREFGQSACYWVCWGSYDNRIQALKAKTELPPGLADPQSEAKAIASLLQ